MPACLEPIINSEVSICSSTEFSQTSVVIQQVFAWTVLDETFVILR